MTRAPAHAGSLRLTERLAFVMMFTAMAGFVVGLSVLAANTGARAVTSRSVANTSGTNAAQQGSEHLQAHSGSQAARTRSAWPSQVLNARLTAALSAALGARAAASLSVGVIDTTTGAEALYRATNHYHAGGIARADIVAALLYEEQKAGMHISRKDAGLAAEVVKNGSSIGVTRLWQVIGRGPGLARANKALGLRRTIPGVADEWALTRTTVTDQLRLLTDLAAARSVLDSASRAYELGLMGGVGPTWRGVPAAASPGTGYAVNGWLAGQRRFVVNSVGITDRGGHELLVVVLSRNWLTEAAGISAVQAAAGAAVSAMPPTA